MRVLAKATKRTAPSDVNQNVHRIFSEMIERSEKPPQRRLLQAVRE
jgi:hypothetical protein